MKTHFLLLIVFPLFVVACGDKFYTEADFVKIPKIDSHVHINTEKSVLVEQAKAYNFKLLTINTNSGDCQHVANQFEWSEFQIKKNPETIKFATTFCPDGWNEPDWVENTLKTIAEGVDAGAISVKVWKNIGMGFRDKNNELVMIDDPQFDPVFKYLVANNIPLTGHLGEPRNCWLPVEEMTVSGDKGYFSGNPKYHMYLHPELPSYEDQLAARDRMLEKNPDLIFVGCHLASLEWSIVELAKWLDRFPNAAVDMAARMSHLYYQSITNREAVREFCIKYQDRLIYGTDIGESEGYEKVELSKRIYETWLFDWKYMTSNEILSSPTVEGEFQGLQLPQGVIGKIFHDNFNRWYNQNSF